MQNHSLRANEWVKIAVDKYLDMVYRLAYAKTGNKADAEDVSQTVFLQLLSRNPEIQSEEHLKHWLIRVTANESVSLFRSAWRRCTLPLEEQLLASTDANPENDILDAALASLSARHRVVVHLFYYEEMTAQEIAAVLGIRPETVRERLHRARKKLKQQMMGKGGNVFV